MGQELLTYSWVSELRPGGHSKHDKAAVEAAIAAITDKWFDEEDDRLQLEFFAGDDFDGMRDYLRDGAVDYEAHIEGTHPYGTSRPIGDGKTFWIHTAGGSSYGDDPYEGWSALGSFLTACAMLPDLAAAAGFVPHGARLTASTGGFDLSTVDWAMLAEQKVVLQEAIEDARGAPGDGDLADARADALTGILHLLDALQDTARDAGFQA